MPGKSATGITSNTVANALYSSFGQRIVTTMYTESNQYRVILEADPGVQNSIRSLEEGGATASIQLPALRLRQASAQQQIDSEIQRILTSLEKEVTVAQRKETEIEDAFANARISSDEANLASVQHQQLEREASANKAVYESFLNRYKQTIEQESLTPQDARLLSRAEVADRPVSPRLIPLLALGLGGGGLLGLGLAFARDQSSDRIRSAQELEELTSAPVLAAKIWMLFAPED